MSEPNVYDPATIHAYDVVATALSAPVAMAAWVDGHVPLHSARVLDLGVGTGISALALADAGAAVIAFLDFHETATWATAREIELMARMTGLEVGGICGGYDGQPYDSRSREMLVRLRSVT